MRFIIYLIIAFSAFCLSLFFVTVPVLKKISLKMQGEIFTFRTALTATSKSNSTSAKYDIYWSAAAVLLSLLITFFLIGLLDYLKIVEFHTPGQLGEDLGD